MKRTWFIVILLAFCAGSYAQNIPFDKKFIKDKAGLKEAKKNLKAGDKYFVLGEPFYRQALMHYLKAQQVNPNNDINNYRIGICYLTAGPKTKAQPYLSKAFELNRTVAADILLQLGRAEHINYEFDKALEHFRAYKQSLNPKQLQELGTMVDKRIDECLVGKELVANPVRVFIENIGSVVNSPYPDYSPIVNADESVLLFTSRRPGSTGDQVTPEDGLHFEDIYISVKVGGEWSTPINPGKPLNTDNHDAIVGLSPDGQRLFLYRGDNGGDIFECYLDGDKWSKPERLDRNINTEFHESSASFSYDLRTIYFVSNKPEGFGNHDIYLSMKLPKGNKWGPAINLGSVINTPYDEEAIFMHPDGKTLYFSSRGHKTMGGYDIFKTVNHDGKWSEPENLGYPINTTDDDVFFTLTADGRHGYYSSAREGGQGGHDIYRIVFMGEEKPLINNMDDNLIAIMLVPVTETVIEPQVTINQSNLTLLKGLISDEETKLPLRAFIEIVDVQKNEVVANFESNSKTGRYLISLPSGRNYGITVRADNYLFHSENVDISESKGYQEIVKDIELKKVAVGSKVVLRNIFFDTGKSSLRTESTAELDRLVTLLTEMPKLTIEISGHTDNVGSAASNKRLSADRAKAVVDYVVKAGISASRLTSVGYGFDQPIAPNNTEEGRQQNRRTEFKITGN